MALQVSLHSNSHLLRPLAMLAGADGSGSLATSGGRQVLHPWSPGRSTIVTVDALEERSINTSHVIKNTRETVSQSVNRATICKQVISTYLYLRRTYF